MDRYFFFMMKYIDLGKYYIFVQFNAILLFHWGEL